MISNPFLYRAADVRSGSMVEDRNFVNLFSIPALGLIRGKVPLLWNIPLLLTSAPGGGKSSLMRIFSPSALRYIQDTAPRGGNQKLLSQQMEEFGVFNNGIPTVLGIWLRMSDEYQSFQQDEASNRQGLFCAILNSRIIISALNGICVLKGLSINKDLKHISLKIKQSAQSITLHAWVKWGSDSGETFYNNMARLEAELCDMIDDPFWGGDPTSLTHTGLWSLDLLANLEVSIYDQSFLFRPLVMLDDVHELSEQQLKYLFNLIMSRQLSIPFWISFRKQALELTDLINKQIGKGIERGRDYEIIDFEENRTDFRKCVLEISTLRVQSVAAQIGGLSQAFVDFLSDEREDVFIEHLDDDVVHKIKEKVLQAAGLELSRFQDLIDEIEKECQGTHDSCKRLRMLEILVARETGKRQKSFLFQGVPIETLKKYENNQAIIEAAELFLARDYKLPYYFSARRLLLLSSNNVQQFLTLAGALFEEIMIAIRLGREKESTLSPLRQHDIIKRVAKNFLKEISSTVRYGNRVLRFVHSLGEMCKNETFRPTAPYAPGVTGTALTMYELEVLVEKASKGDDKSIALYQTIQSAIAHNILEPVPNYRCKSQDFLVLYLNRLLCVCFQLPLQRGGFREKSLSTFNQWISYEYKKGEDISRQMELWQ